MTNRKDVYRGIGQSLKRFRLQEGLMQIDVAVATNLNRTYISKIETGKARITFNLLKKLVTGLDIKSTTLVGY